MDGTQEPCAPETRSELARLRAARNRNVFVAVVAVAVAGAILVGGGLWAARQVSGRGTRGVGSTSGDRPGASTSTSSASDSTPLTEVPDLLGMGIAEASTVLQTAGFPVQLSESGTPTVPSRRVVLSQEPSGGVLAASDGTVTVVVQPAKRSATSAGPIVRPGAARGLVVVLDPGHQSHSNSRPEPIGPDSKTLRPSMTAGGAGVLTDVPEFEITLELATNVRKRLEAAGVKVVMTRETNDVDLSNAARAAIANEARASLFVRLDADSDPDPTLSGVSTLYPASNPWTRAIAASSKRAAGLVQKRASSATGAVNRGTAERSDVTGFNWAKVPSILVQTGYPSNAVEDRLLGSPGYQDKLSSGIAEGIVAYLKGRK